MPDTNPAATPRARASSVTPQLAVSVRELGRRPGTSKELETAFEAPPGLGTDVIAVSAGDLVRMDLLLESVLEGVLASGRVQAQAVGECARCLGAAVFPVDTTFQELFVYPERADAARGAGDGADEEQPEVVGDVLDLEPAVRDAIVLALPFRPLCREDCSGLCSECGVRLEDEPGHAHRTVDARWAVLEDLLEDEREER